MRTRTTLWTVSVAAIACLAFAMAASSVDGKWDGIAYGDQEIPFTTVFRTENGNLSGSMDIPGLGLYELALRDISLDANTLKFVVPIPEDPADCTATIGEDGSIDGKFTQSAGGGTFKMTRSQQ